MVFKTDGLCDEEILNLLYTLYDLSNRQNENLIFYLKDVRFYFRKGMSKQERASAFEEAYMTISELSEE